MTISSVYTNQPTSIGKNSDIFTPEKQEATQGRETLQEVTDQAKLSSLAPRIQSVLSQMAGADGDVMSTLSSNIDKLQEGFLETLYTTLTEGEVNLSEKLTLRLGNDTVLTVAGDHPEKEKVDVLLAENPALSEAFGEIASQSEVMRDIANINKVMTRQTGAEAYSMAEYEKTSNAVYQMSLKGDMSHFYFSRG